jgi:hypothetical protein
MKQKILLCCICAFLFFSCKKDKKVTPAPKLYPVSFNLSGFTQTQVPIGKAKTASLGTQATDTVPVQSLVYMLFQLQGSLKSLGLISQRRIEKGDPGFGTFTDNVAAGTYTAVFIGGSDNLKILLNNYFSYTTSLYPATTYWDDTFYKSIPITVSAGSLNQAISMKRITARLDLVLKDAIPTGTKKITVSFKDTAVVDAYTGKTYIDRNQSVTNVTSKAINTSDIGTTNYTITMYTLNNVTPFDVTISYYGADASNPLGTKVVNNVVCKVNTITTLSGNLFTAANSEFKITVNQDWNTVNVGF